MEKAEQIDNFYLKLPATFAIIGSSRSGKTYLLWRILSQLSHVAPGTPPISKFVLVIRHYQDIYEQMIAAIQEMYPDCEIRVFTSYPNDTLGNQEFWKIPEFSQSVLLIDDCADQVGSSFDFLCRGLAHHKNISLFYLSQDYSSEPAVVKSGLKNAHYYILTKSSQSGLLLSDLNRRMYMYSPRFLAKCYEKIMSSQPYGYMIIDKTVDCDRKRSVKTGLFLDEDKYVIEPVD